MAKKKTKIFNLTTLTALMVFNLTSCSKTYTSTSSSTSSSSFNADDYDLKNVVFEDAEVLYDGMPHSIVAKNVPNTVKVTYTNNVGTEIGTYNAVAHFESIDGKTIYKDKYATLKIVVSGTNSSVNFSKVTMSDIVAVYDGSTHTAKLDDASLIPSGFKAVYSNNAKRNAGTYVARCDMVNIKTGVTHYSIFSNITINKAEIDMSGVTFPSQTYPFSEGVMRYIYVQGTLPKNVTVTYTDNYAREAGKSVTAIATFHSTDSNYKDPSPMTATLSISSNQTCQVIIQYYMNNSFYTSTTLSKKFGETITEDDILQQKGYSYRSSVTLPYEVSESSATLRIEYQPIEYECSFSVDHGKKDALTYKVTDNYVISDPIMDAGYEFVGWFEDKAKTIPLTTLYGKTGNITLYAFVQELTNRDAFVLKNTTVTWDSTEKDITTAGVLASNRTVTYTYEKLENDTATLLTGKPTDVGTYRVTGHFHNRDVNTGEVDSADAYTQVAFLTIEKVTLSTNSLTFNSTEFYVNENKYPTVSAINSNVTYYNGDAIVTIPFYVETTYTYYDSSFVELAQAPTTEGQYFVKASFAIKDSYNDDATDRINPIDDIYTQFTIKKRTYSISGIKFTNKTYEANSDASAAVDGYFVLNAVGLIEKNGKFYDPTEKLIATYYNNKLSANDIGSLNASIVFSWSENATEEDKKLYSLPNPLSATISVVADKTSYVIFQYENGQHIFQAEVITGQPAPAPQFPNDLTDPNEEYYWDSDVGNQFSSVEKVTTNTVFTLKKRNRQAKIVISGYYDNGTTISNNISSSTLTTSYNKETTSSLQDLMVNFSRGYEFVSFKIGKLSSSSNEYYTDAIIQKTITTNDAEYSLNFFDLYKKVFNENRIDDMIIQVVSQPKTVDVEFDLNGGDFTSEDAAIAIEEINNSKTQTFGTYYKLPTKIPVKDNMKFVGWQVNSGIVDKYVYCDLIAEDGVKFIIKAIYEDTSHYSITFNRKNGDASTIYDITSESEIVFPESTPSLFGYTFVGWKLNGATYDNGTPVNPNNYDVIISNGVFFNSAFMENYFGTSSLKSLVFEAVWEAVDVTIKLYSFEYDSTGSLKIYRQVTGKFGNVLLDLLPVDERGNLLYPENAGSDFMYWSYNGYQIINDTTITTLLEEDGSYYITLSPVYNSKTFSIVYDYNYSGCSSYIQQVKSSDTYSLISDPSRTGYVFDYWYIDGDVDENGVPINFVTNHYDVDDGKFIYNKNLILKAHWTLKQFRISFYNQSQNLNYTDGNSYPYGTLIDSSHGWIDTEQLYTVLGFSRADEFYFTDSTGRVLVEGSPLLYDGENDTTYTIYVLKTTNSFLVTYVTDTGTNVQLQRVLSGSDFTLLPSPTKPGMLFKAWYYYTGDGTVEVTGSTFRLPYNADLTLYARFTPLQYSIRYLTTTGYEIHKETIVTFGQAFSLPNASEISINGYNFLSWRDQYGNPVSNDTILSDLPLDSNSIILYAELEPSSYTITYDPNNGDVPFTSNTKYSQPFNVYPNPIRTGYSFAGWQFYDADTNLSIIGEVALLLKQGTFTYAGNVKAKALWTGVEYTVKFSFKGLKVNKDTDGNYSLADDLSDILITSTVALGSNIYMLYNDNIFNSTIEVDGKTYSCYREDEDNIYINPVGIYYESLDSWVESSTNVAVRHTSSSRYVLSVIGGTQFTASYTNKSQVFAFFFKSTNSYGGESQYVIQSVSYSFGDTITFPSYPSNDLYDFYGWTASEDYIYDESKYGVDGTSVKYEENTTATYDVLFDRYASKNNFFFNLVYDTLKSYYIIKLDGTKYLKVNPASTFSEDDDIYTKDASNDSKNLAMTDDVIGLAVKGQSIVLPNIACNNNNNYYLEVTVDQVKFHPCDRTVYKIGSEYMIDGQLLNIGILGSKEDPLVLEAYSCYVAGENRTVEIMGKDAEGNPIVLSTETTYSDFMIMKDTDANNVSFVNGNGYNLSGLNEVAFCGFVNREGAQANEIDAYWSAVTGCQNFYVPPFYFDGEKVKKVSMIASGAMEDGAFKNIKFYSSANIHLPDTIETIQEDTFTGITTKDYHCGDNATSSFTLEQYNSGAVQGKIIYEGSLANFRNNVTVYDTTIKSSGAEHPVWCYDSVAGMYEKDVNYSILKWWSMNKDTLDNEFLNTKYFNLVNDTAMYINEGSSITLNYFYGSFSEYIKYCNENYPSKIAGAVNLNRDNLKNQYIACFDEDYHDHIDDPSYFYPQLYFIGNNSSNDYSMSKFLTMYTSETVIDSYSIKGRLFNIVEVTDVTNGTYNNTPIYLANAEYAMANYDDLLDRFGNKLSEGILPEYVNIVSDYTYQKINTVFYNMDLPDFFSSSYVNDGLNRIVYTTKDVNGTKTLVKVYNTEVDFSQYSTSGALATALRAYYNTYVNEFVYFITSNTDATYSEKNSELFYFGTISDLLTNSSLMEFAKSQTSLSNVNINVISSKGAKTVFFPGTFDEYVANRKTAGFVESEIFDGKTLITTLSSDSSSTVETFLGTPEQFIEATKDKTISPKAGTTYRAVFGNNYDEYYIYYGDKQTFTNNNYGAYAGKFVSCVDPSTDTNDILFVGNIDNFSSKTYGGDATFSSIYKQLLNLKNDDLIYVYSANSSSSVALPVLLATTNSSSFNDVLKTYIDSSDYKLGYVYLNDIIEEPTSTNYNFIIPYTTLSFTDAYNLTTTEPLYNPLRNAKYGFISSVDGLSSLSTADNYYANALSNDTLYAKLTSLGYDKAIVFLSEGISSSMITNETYYTDYFFKTADAVTITDDNLNRFYKVFTSTADRSPIEYFTGSYAKAQEEAADTDKYSTYFTDKFIYYNDSSLIDNFFNGIASDYLSSSYVTNDSFNGAESVIKLKDGIYFYFGDFANITATNVTNDQLKYDQIYALFNNDNTTTKSNAQLVVYYAKSSEEYRKDYTKWSYDGTVKDPTTGKDVPAILEHAISTDKLDNPNDYVIIGNNAREHNLLLLDKTMTVTPTLINKFESVSNKNAEIIINTTYTKASEINTVTVVTDKDGKNSGSSSTTYASETRYNSTVAAAYLGSLKEFNTANRITSISDFNSSSFNKSKSYIYTLDNLTYSSSRSLVPAFYLNYDDIVDSQYLVSQTTTDSDTDTDRDITAGTTTVTTITTTSTITELFDDNLIHLAFSNLPNYNFPYNVATFDNVGNINGIETDYLAFTNNYSSSTDTTELPYVMVNTSTSSSASRVEDAYLITTDIYDSKPALSLIYTGTYYTNDNNDLKTVSRTIDGVVSGSFNFIYPGSSNTLVTGSDTYHQLLTINSSTKFTFVKFTHINISSDDGAESEDSVAMYPGKKSKLESNYTKLSLYTDKDSWHGTAATDTKEEVIGAKYSVFVVSDDGNSVVKAY